MDFKGKSGDLKGTKLQDRLHKGKFEIKVHNALKSIILTSSSHTHTHVIAGEYFYLRKQLQNCKHLLDNQSISYSSKPPITSDIRFIWSIRFVCIPCLLTIMPMVNVSIGYCACHFICQLPDLLLRLLSLYGLLKTI